ncbi:hypothetical protein CPLU01_11486 [Colletotrichum plurivorum]|uniref:Uncharacterized protein n=1 Tax=Colletotrichum plurivorum TaxID=2175906 RepID=A0A8H6K2U5_9PEZI|nr:hypothetical protein CPLU01_11486 [Colletotrichum plurivorum]
MASLRIDGSVSASSCLFGVNALLSNALVQCSGPNGDGRNGEEQQRPAFSAGRGNSAEPLAEVLTRRPTLSSEWIRKLSRPSDVRYCSESAEVGRKPLPRESKSHPARSCGHVTRLRLLRSPVPAVSGRTAM